MLGVSKLLFFAIPIFVLAMDAIAISLVATSWLAYEAAAAITTSCLMGVLIIVSSIVCIPPVLVLAWYMLLGRKRTVERAVQEHNKSGSTGSFEEDNKSGST